MSVDLNTQDSTFRSVGGQILSRSEGGSEGSTGSITHVSKTEIASTWSAARGPAGSVRYKVFKRVMDIVLVLAAVPVLVPLFLLIAAAVRISSPGPIFFSHRRIRGHGVFFTMWKFRTMCANSGEVLQNYLNANTMARLEWLSTHKLKQDPRITAVGAFLRKTSLDELPQLWNVLNGSMSLVGPRPIVAAEVERYGDRFSSYCMVKPGITGLWQVSGRSRTSYEVRVSLDTRYVRNWTLTGDLAILFKTLYSVLNQDGAY